MAWFEDGGMVGMMLMWHYFLYTSFSNVFLEHLRAYSGFSQNRKVVDYLHIFPMSGHTLNLELRGESYAPRNICPKNIANVPTGLFWPI